MNYYVYKRIPPVFMFLFVCLFFNNSPNQNESSSESNSRMRNQQPSSQSLFVPKPLQGNNTSQFQTPTESYSEQTFSHSGLSSGVTSSSGISKLRSQNPTPDTCSFRMTPRVCMWVQFAGEKVLVIVSLEKATFTKIIHECNFK